MDKKSKGTAYFVGAFAGKEKYGVFYERIAEIVRTYGYTVYDDVNTISVQNARARTPEEIEKYWKLTAAKNIEKADIFIAEITEKSTAIGIEIGMSVSDYKPTLLLRESSKISPLPVPLIALKSRLTVKDYTKDNLESIITQWLKKVDQGLVTKFMNIGFTKDQVDFIEYIQRKEKIKSFALTVRSLINGNINVQQEREKFFQSRNDD